MSALRKRKIQVVLPPPAPRHIESKQHFYSLSRKLLLGNILNQWNWAVFEKTYAKNPSSLPEIVGVRHVRQAFTNKGISGLMTRTEAYAYGMALPVPERYNNILIDEGAVHDRLTIQGEIMGSDQGLYVRYSSLQCHQRTLWHIDQNGLRGLRQYQLPHNLSSMSDKQKKGSEPVVLHAFGIRASALLQTHMDPSSWDKLNEILQDFHYPVVEFACFKGVLGQLKWNTLFWEVRTRY